MFRALTALFLALAIASPWCCCGFGASCHEPPVETALAAAEGSLPAPSCCACRSGDQTKTEGSGLPVEGSEEPPCSCCHRDSPYGPSEAVVLPAPLASLPEATPFLGVSHSVSAPKCLDAGEWLGRPPQGRPPLHQLFEVYLC